MYYLSKLVWSFLEPTNLLCLLALVGLAMSHHAPRLGRRLMGGAVLALAIVGVFPVGTLLLRPLEARFPPWTGSGLPVAGAIVLGGAVDPYITDNRGLLSLNDAAERVTAMLSIARQHPGARLVFTGGSAELGGGNSEASALERTLPAIAPGLTVTWERQSRNTVENAAMTRALVSPQPGQTWLLVTSAWHMPRAVGIFRAAGFDVVAHPVDYRTAGDHADLWPTPSVSAGLRRVDFAAKEWVGMLFAYLSGKSNALFPAP